MILDILTHPNPLLRQRAEFVRSVDASLHTLLKNMHETMVEYVGVGLAAPQVGVLQRILVVQYKERKLSLINPEITFQEGMEVANEGCLSLPNYRLDVPRAAHIVVKAKNKLGQSIVLKEKNMVARIIQHEMDHLNGILILDYEK